MTYLIDMLNLTCTIERAANAVETTYGSVGRDYDDDAIPQTGVLCAIQAGTDSEAMEYNRRTGKVVYRCYFLPGTDVRITDQITTIAGNVSNLTGRTLRVVSPGNDVAGQSDYTTCLATFYTGGTDQ